MIPKNFVTEILKKVLPKIGGRLVIEPEFECTGLIIFSNGKKTFYRSTRFNINNIGSVEVAKDKNYASFFLKKFGYNVPEGQTFFSEKLNRNISINRTIEDGYRYAKSLGLPVIVKPNNLSQGLFVTKVSNKKEYLKAARKIFKVTNVMIVERFCQGNDYRIVVLDKKIISAYRRVSLTLEGDGTSTILELLNAKQKEFTDNGRDTIIDIYDYRISLILKKNKASFDTILLKNEFFQIFDNANLSTGGMSYDVTQNVHSDYSNLAIKITSDMELRLCGVDIITEDITQPLKEYVIIELNSAPGLDNYSAMGERQVKMVDDLYLEILKYLEEN